MTRHRFSTDPLVQEQEAKAHTHRAQRLASRAMQLLDRGHFGVAEEALHESMRHARIAQRNTRLLDQRSTRARPEA